jgi:hypothetical protein
MGHPWRRSAAWGSIGLACSACPDAAHAAEPAHAIELTWRAPAGCPNEAWARKAIDGYLGHRKIEAFKPIAVRVEITAAAGGRWRAALSMRGGASGDRAFEGATCARVGDAAVLIVALMLDPVEVVAQMDTARDDDARPASPLLAENGRRAAAGRSPVRFDLAVLATGDAGSLPQPTVGAGVAAGVHMSHISLQADVVAWIPRRAFGGPTGASGGEIGLYTASVRGCLAAMGALGLALAPCLRAEGGLASGTGFGIAEPTTTRNFWGAAFVGLSIRQASTERLGAWLAVEGGVPFVWPNYFIEEFGTVFRAGPVLGRVSFGLAWSFP